MNYFEFYGIPLSFQVDPTALKKQFYRLSKKYHPDFYTQESAEKQAEILELSTLNNKAYKTLSDFDLRMKYILELEEVLGEEGKNQIPQDFLMEMMDINEQLMELEFDFDQNTHNQVLQALEQQENQSYQSIASIIDDFEHHPNRAEALKKIKEYYLKKRYLLRIRKNLDKFASP